MVTGSEAPGGNPYGPPLAPVADRASDTSGLAEMARVVPAMHSLDWYGCGWRLFRVAPWAWIGLWLIFLACVVVLTLVPLLGPVVQGVVNPIFIGGAMLAARSAERDGHVRVSQVFGGFRSHAGGLALLGLLQTVAWLLLAVLAGIVAAVFIGTVMAPHPAAKGPPPPAFFGPFAAMGIVVGLLNAPIINATVLASGLVALHDLGAMEALRRGFVGTFRNLRAFALFMLFSFVFAFAALLPLGLGLLVFGPVVLAAMYAQLTDLFAAPERGAAAGTV